MKRKLQVFVSSTFTDLQEERQAAVSAILKAGHIPAGMELFTSSNQSQMNTIRKWIDESDVYMLILGGRYGSIEPTSGISYTELEYDYASQQNKALFSIVINEDALESKVKKLGISAMEQENPKQLKMFREKVLSNISSFFDDSKDVKLCVHESLSDFVSDSTLKGWVSATEITSSQQLLDELTSLRKDNEKLSEELSNAHKRLQDTSESSSQNNESFEDLIQLLKTIEIKIPKHLINSAEDTTTNLYNIFTAYKGDFIIGVSNQHGSSDIDIFLYYNVCPKLQIHDLLIIERPSGVQWSRFETTKKCQELLGYIDKKNLSKDEKQGSGDTNT